MAKVLFVVYVPSTEPEERNDDDNVDQATDTIDDSQEEVKDTADGDEKPKPDDKPDTNDTQTGDVVGQSEEQTDEQTEASGSKNGEENNEIPVDDPSNNIFFKKEEKIEGDVEETKSITETKDCEETKSTVETKDCEETKSTVETKDTESCVNEDNDVPEPDTNESEKEEKEPAFVRFVSNPPLVEKVKRVLDDLNLGGVQWNMTEQSVHVGMFVADYGSQCEDILRKLSMLQIGVIKGSSVSVFPASISSEEKWVEKEFEEEKLREDELSEKVSQFKDSIKSRLVVDQVVNAVQNDAMFTFDYLMLVILASLVAMMGLLESSSVVLVASMLISPLMGPILAGVFGVVIRKGELVRVGIINELWGLLICVLIGFIIGFIPASLETGTTSWRSSTEWPTPEMSSRGALRALPVGILIAIPSGAGVALSILGGKVGSLVGVAISASLLPPAVNAGLLWANAIVTAISPPSVVQPLSILNPNVTTTTGGYYNTEPDLSCWTLLDNDYERQYFCNMAKENAVLGCVSLLLTILNIVCIIFMGVIVLKIKEVAPIPHSFIPESENEFFCHDLRIARESNITMKGQAAAAIRKDWLKSYQEMKSECGKADEGEEKDEDEFCNILDEVEGSPSVLTIYDKMQIRPSGWRRAMNAVRNNCDGFKKFDFSHPTPSRSPREDAENGIELRRRRVQSPSSRTPSTGQEEDEKTNSVYFTVHRYIHPTDLGGESYSLKSGKTLTTLKLPKASRFMIAKVAEDSAEEASTTQPQVSKKSSLLPTVSESGEPETQPLLNSETATDQ